MTPTQDARSARRETARERARALREAQAKRERRARLIIVGVAVAVVALVAVTLVVILGSSQESDLETVASPQGADDTGGIVVGVDGVGAPTPDAPTVAVYADFMCPVCEFFESVNGEMLEELRTSGEATLVQHPVAILDRASNGTQYSTRSANAVAVVADAAPEQFTAFWEALFANQPEENTAGLSDEEIARLAVDVGVPEDVAATFADGEFTDWVTAATLRASEELAPFGTPTIVIDGTVYEEDWRDTEALRGAIVGDG